jgi:uncharacterized protein
MQNSVFKDTEENWITIYLTNKCNLKCAYCFGLSLEPKDLEKEKLKKIIDWFFNNSISEKRGISFFGGEPLLRFELIKYAVEYATSKDKNMRFSITTNGTLLNEEIVDFFNKYFSIVNISIDGKKETHDYYRKTILGEGSFDKINFNLIKKITKPELYIQSVVTPITVKNLFENAVFFHKLGLKQVIMLSPDFIWKKDDLKIYKKEIKKLAKYFISCLKQNRNPFDLYYFTTLFSEDHKSKYPCPAGRQSLTISVNGDIYPCHRFLCGGINKIGNIDEKNYKTDFINHESFNYSKKIKSKNKVIDLKVCPYNLETTCSELDFLPEILIFREKLKHYIVSELKKDILFFRKNYSLIKFLEQKL